MKRCPKCGQQYGDPDLNFCLNDGELLMQLADSSFGSTFGRESGPGFADDAPPTIMMSDPRATNPTGWSGPSAPVQWQSQTPAYQAPQPGLIHFTRSLDQTLPTVSLILGVFAAIFVCCYGGLWLGLPAALLGFMGLRNADSDPTKFGGRGLAIAGMVLGVITFILSTIFIILQILGSIS